MMVTTKAKRSEARDNSYRECRRETGKWVEWDAGEPAAAYLLKGANCMPLHSGTSTIMITERGSNALSPEKRQALIRFYTDRQTHNVRRILVT
jgi:hypothetical protein